MKRRIPSSPAPLGEIGVLLGAMCVRSWAGEPYLVKDINRNGIGFPIGLTAMNGRLFFNVDDGIHGQ